MALEPARAVIEFASLIPSMPMLAATPRGDGHVVLVLPGMLTDDAWTSPLRSFLELRNFDARPWTLGTNLGRVATRAALERRFLALVERADAPISLVGWSLGGVMARAIASHYPECVRQLVTLGSPIGGSPVRTAAWQTFEHLDPDARARLRERMRRHPIGAPAGVATSAIYSRNDAIVPWQIAREVSAGERIENIRVNGSHMGMGFNPAVLYAVVDRLAQPVDSWRPFSPPWPLRGLYPRPDATT